MTRHPLAGAVQSLDHVVLRVRDMDRALAFYQGVFGLKEERRVDSLGLVQLRAGAALIDLIPAGDTPPGPAGNMDHFCLTLDPFEEADIRSHLTAQGVAAGPTQRRYGARGYGPSIYIEDPDGNTVELKGPPEAQSG